MGSSADPPKDYIHLLDGGIADNLGVAEPIRILSTNEPSPGYLDDIANGDIKNIIFIMINARSFAASGLDQKPDTPGVIDMLMGSISSSVDRATFGSAAMVRIVLGEKLTSEAKRLRDSARRATEKNQLEVAADLNRRATNLEAAAANAKLIPVDFDGIQDAKCRQDFHNIGTSWQNSKAEIDGLLLVGDALLHQAPDYSAALRIVGGIDPGTAPSVTVACNALKVK
jgi:NTE family protein